jgi:hypothetical protein
VEVQFHRRGSTRPQQRRRRRNRAQPRLARALLNPNSNEEDYVQKSLTTTNQKGRVAVPILLWMAGVPFTLVFLLWLFFFRGH